MVALGLIVGPKLGFDEFDQILFNNQQYLGRTVERNSQQTRVNRECAMSFELIYYVGVDNKQQSIVGLIINRVQTLRSLNPLFDEDHRYNDEVNAKGNGEFSIKPSRHNVDDSNRYGRLFVWPDYRNYS